jgi:hypothetical protein
MATFKVGDIIRDTDDDEVIQILEDLGDYGLRIHLVRNPSKARRDHSEYQVLENARLDGFGDWWVLDEVFLIKSILEKYGNER